MVKFMHQEHTKYNKKKRKVKEIIKLVFFSLLHSNVVYIYTLFLTNLNLNIILLQINRE
jgi:hypothetical protein